MALTHEEEQLRYKLHAQGLSNKEIADITGADQKSLSSWFRYRGMRSNKSHIQQEAERNHKRRLKMIERGMSFDRIAKAEKVTRKTILDWARKADVTENYGMKTYDMTHRPDNEKEFLRGFFRDLVWYYDSCHKKFKPDISRFMYVWSVERGGRSRKASWDSGVKNRERNNSQVRPETQTGNPTGNSQGSRVQRRRSTLHLAGRRR